MWPLLLPILFTSLIKCDVVIDVAKNPNAVKRAADDKDITKIDYEGYGWPTFNLGNKQEFGLNSGYDRNVQEYRNQNRYFSNDLSRESDYRSENDDITGLTDTWNDNSRQRYPAREDRYYDDETKRRLDRIFGYNGPSGNDEPENLVRPCALDDWLCIRKFFSANGDCKAAYGPIPDPLYLDVNTVYFPVINVTVSFPDLVIRGLSSAKVNDFYINKKSGNLVFAIDVQNLNLSSPRAYVRYRRTAKESIIIADFATINFRSVTLTAVIPKVPKLRLDYADIHATTQDPAPVYIYAPGTHASLDPDVVTAFAQFPPNLKIAVQEGMLFESQLFMGIFIQENVCDFGLKLIST